MKRITLLLILILGITSPLLGQSNQSKGHFFAGYAYNRMDADGKLDSGLGVPEPGGMNLNGFNVAGGFTLGTSSVTDDISLTFDAGGYFNTLNNLSGDSNYLRQWTLTAGPQFTSRRHHLLHPFVRALFGVSYIQSKIAGVKESDTGFAFIGGGGLDIQLGDVAAWRMVQLDYLLARHFGENLNSLRVATGIAFNF